jgi:hypothetical protein
MAAPQAVLQGTTDSHHGFVARNTKPAAPVRIRRFSIVVQRSDEDAVFFRRHPDGRKKEMGAVWEECR